MIHIEPIELDNGIAIGIEVNVPKTKILVIKTNKGYIMCGVLDIKTLDRLHPEREIIAAKAEGVKTLDDLLKATIKEATKNSKLLGIKPGITIGKEALEKMM
jgi:uncharacterized protein YunC (DUF1805 family)